MRTWESRPQVSTEDYREQALTMEQVRLSLEALQADVALQRSTLLAAPVENIVREAMRQLETDHEAMREAMRESTVMREADRERFELLCSRMPDERAALADRERLELLCSQLAEELATAQRQAEQVRSAEFLSRCSESDDLIQHLQADMVHMKVSMTSVRGSLGDIAELKASISAVQEGLRSRTQDWVSDREVDRMRSASLEARLTELSDFTQSLRNDVDHLCVTVTSVKGLHGGEITDLKTTVSAVGERLRSMAQDWENERNTDRAMLASFDSRIDACMEVEARFEELRDFVRPLQGSIELLQADVSAIEGLRAVSDVLEQGLRSIEDRIGVIMSDLADMQQLRAQHAALSAQHVELSASVQANQSSDESLHALLHSLQEQMATQHSALAADHEADRRRLGEFEARLGVVVEEAQRSLSATPSLCDDVRRELAEGLEARLAEVFDVVRRSEHNEAKLTNLYDVLRCEVAVLQAELRSRVQEWVADQEANRMRADSFQERLRMRDRELAAEADASRWRVEGLHTMVTTLVASSRAGSREDLRLQAMALRDASPPRVGMSVYAGDVTPLNSRPGVSAVAFSPSVPS